MNEQELQALLAPSYGPLLDELRPPAPDKIRVSDLLNTYNPQPAHCQRALVWAESNYSHYLRGVLGKYGNGVGHFLLAFDKATYQTYVVDGQHRIKALREFFYGGRRVALPNGQSIAFTELDEESQKWVKQHAIGTATIITMPHYMSNLVEQMYDDFNYTLKGATND